MENEPKDLTKDPNPDLNPGPTPDPDSPLSPTIGADEAAATDQPLPVPERGSGAVESLNRPTASDNLGAQMDALVVQAEAQEQTTKKKKKFARIIVFVAIGVLLLGGGAFGAIWLMNYQEPENVVLDAMVKAIDRKAIKLSSSLTLRGKTLEEIGVKSIAIESSSEGSVILPVASETIMRITSMDGDQLEVKVGGTFLADGALYFRVDGLTETIEGMLAEELLPLFEYVSEILEEVEGKWWKFDIADFDVFEDFAEGYNCIIDALAAMNTDGTRKELGELYKKWPLFDVKKTDMKDGSYNGYNVTLNAVSGAGFLNGFKGTEPYKKLAKCAGSIDEDFEDYMDIEAGDIDVPDNMPIVTFFIHSWSHELRSIRISYADEDADLDMRGEIVLEFLDSVNVSAPENAKPVQELIENVMMKICAPDEEEEDCAERWNTILMMGLIPDLEI